MGGPHSLNTLTGPVHLCGISMRRGTLFLVVLVGLSASVATCEQAVTSEIQDAALRAYVHTTTLRRGRAIPRAKLLATIDNLVTTAMERRCGNAMLHGPTRLVGENGVATVPPGVPQKLLAFLQRLVNKDVKKLCSGKAKGKGKRRRKAKGGHSSASRRQTFTDADFVTQNAQCALKRGCWKQGMASCTKNKCICKPGYFGHDAVECDRGDTRSDEWSRMSVRDQRLGALAAEVSLLAYNYTSVMKKCSIFPNQKQSIPKSRVEHLNPQDCGKKGGTVASAKGFIHGFHHMQFLSGVAKRAVQGGMPFLAFRGSVEFEDWLSNQDWHLLPQRLKGFPPFHAHRGTWTQIQSHKKKLLKAVTRIVQGHKEILLCGHSLGGQTATLFSVVLKAAMPHLKIHLHTFGSPRPGDKGFAAALAQAVPGGVGGYHTINCTPDCARRRPKMSWGPGLPPSRFLTHSDPAVWISRWECAHGGLPTAGGTFCKSKEEMLGQSWFVRALRRQYRQGMRNLKRAAKKSETCGQKSEESTEARGLLCG